MICFVLEFIRVVGREGKRPEIPKQCPRRLRELIQKCWAQDPTLRPSFEQIAESNVFYRIIVEGTREWIFLNDQITFVKSQEKERRKERKRMSICLIY
jgi:hypothetical protein